MDDDEAEDDDDEEEAADDAEAADDNAEDTFGQPPGLLTFAENVEAPGAPASFGSDVCVCVCTKQ